MAQCGKQFPTPESWKYYMRNVYNVYTIHFNVYNVYILMCILYKYTGVCINTQECFFVWRTLKAC